MSMGPDDFEVQVDVSIRNYQGRGDLRLSERVTIPDCTFADMAEILAGFHGMAQAMADAKAKEAGL
jgi:hypothetical protein